MTKNACAELKKHRAALWRQFTRAGGRGVDLAEQIDVLDRQIRRCTRKPAARPKHR
jgi:hypothetical protein